MALTELILILLGAWLILFWLAKVLVVLCPRVCHPVPNDFITSMGKWAVITGGSNGIGKAYAQELAKRGLNVVIISRSKENLDRAAKEIELQQHRKVITIAADFTKDDVHRQIKEEIEELDIAVLVNNVGILPSLVPRKLLETVHLEEQIYRMINCNVKTMVKMCHIVLPGMIKRGRGIILNISSGMAKVPFPMYTLYAASKVFVERFSLGLQTEYKSSGILIQAVSPFGVSTPMTGYQEPNLVTFTPEKFVRSALTYLRAGEQTYGSISHALLGWILQVIPTRFLRSEAFHHNFQEYVKKRVKSDYD